MEQLVAVAVAAAKWIVRALVQWGAVEVAKGLWVRWQRKLRSRQRLGERPGPKPNGEELGAGGLGPAPHGDRVGVRVDDTNPPAEDRLSRPVSDGARAPGLEDSGEG